MVWFNWIIYTAVFAVISGIIVIRSGQVLAKTSVSSLNNVPLGLLAKFYRAPAVRNVRVKAYNGKTQVVLDISKPLNVRYDISSNGTAVFLDFKNIEWVAEPFEPRHSEGSVLEFKYSSNEKGGRLNILTDKPVALHTPFLLKPNGARGHRIVIELTPKN